MQRLDALSDLVTSECSSLLVSTSQIASLPSMVHHLVKTESVRDDHQEMALHRKIAESALKGLSSYTVKFNANPLRQVYRNPETSFSPRGDTDSELIANSVFKNLG